MNFEGNQCESELRDCLRFTRFPNPNQSQNSIPQSIPTIPGGIATRNLTDGDGCSRNFFAFAISYQLSTNMFLTIAHRLPEKFNYLSRFRNSGGQCVVICVPCKKGKFIDNRSGVKFRLVFVSTKRFDGKKNLFGTCAGKLEVPARSAQYISLGTAQESNRKYRYLWKTSVVYS